MTAISCHLTSYFFLARGGIVTNPYSPLAKKTAYFSGFKDNFQYPSILSQNKMKNSNFLDQNVYQDGIVLWPFNVCNNFCSFAVKNPRQHHHGIQSAAPPQNPGHILCT